ncbi:hypothetical protein MCHI_002134 [Candidatus Magnetoovum chiemensis]|nr:hypothetical protein MCHI_002134 [Candidatus Magnetoovum chiemensis]
MNYKGENIIMENSENTIDKSTLIEIYKTQWNDIHHNREQDWKLANIIFVSFVGYPLFKWADAFNGAKIIYK